MNKRKNSNKSSHILTVFSCMILAIASCIASCGNKDSKADASATISSQRLKGDKTVYGLACDGCTDSVVVLLPEDGSDPVNYNIIAAKRAGRVLGKLQIGDRIGVVLNERDSTVADIVVDIDKLQGIWCYIVMPTLREAQSLSGSQAKQMSDSLRETFFIPREYGFYLKRDWVAQSVGYVDDTNSLADESPVVYPPLGYFTAWHLWNGKFVMTSGTPKMTDDGEWKVEKLQYDTCSIDYLDADSLVLSDADGSRSYYRKQSLDDVNKKAKAVAAMLSKKALEQTKE